MMTLDPEIQAALALDLQRFGPAPAHLPGDPAAARAEQERRRAPWNVGGPQMAVQRDIAIALPDRVLPVRLYVPKLPAQGLVVYLHGGGWVMGSLDTHDRLTRALAAASGLAILSINYRKAPEHPYPAALEDTLELCNWLASNPDILGFPVRMDRLAFAGDSAGATIAVAAAMTLGTIGKPVPIAVASIYGVLDSDLDTVSYLMRGDGRYGLSRSNMGLYWSLYCPDPTRRRDAMVAPARAPAMYLEHLRRPFLLAAGLDPLRDDSRRMRDLLLAAGIAATYVEFPRANHGFLHLSSVSAAAREALSATAGHLRTAFADQ
jgi:acetyl esterase